MPEQTFTPVILSIVIDAILANGEEGYAEFGRHRQWPGTPQRKQQVRDFGACMVAGRFNAARGPFKIKSVMVDLEFPNYMALELQRFDERAGYWKIAMKDGRRHTGFESRADFAAVCADFLAAGWVFDVPPMWCIPTRPREPGLDEDLRPDELGITETAYHELMIELNGDDPDDTDIAPLDPERN